MIFTTLRTVKEGKYFFVYNSHSNTIETHIAGPNCFFGFNFISDIIDDIVYFQDDLSFPNKLWCVKYNDVDFRQV